MFTLSFKTKRLLVSHGILVGRLTRAKQLMIITKWLPVIGE